MIFLTVEGLNVKITDVTKSMDANTNRYGGGLPLFNANPSTVIIVNIVYIIKYFYMSYNSKILYL